MTYINSEYLEIIVIFADLLLPLQSISKNSKTKETNQMQITNEEMKFLLKSQQGELDAVLMYKALANKVKKEEEAEAFRQLAADEGRHAAVLKQITKTVLKPRKNMARIMPILYSILGRKRLYRIIAQGEYAAIDKYTPFVARFPEIESLKNDERRHGDVVMGLLVNG